MWSIRYLLDETYDRGHQKGRARLRLSISAVLGAVLSGAIIFPLHAQDASGPMTAGELRRELGIAEQANPFTDLPEKEENMFSDLIPEAKQPAQKANLPLRLLSG